MLATYSISTTIDMVVQNAQPGFLFRSLMPAWHPQGGGKARLIAPAGTDSLAPSPLFGIELGTWSGRIRNCRAAPDGDRHRLRGCALPRVCRICLARDAAVD